MVFDRRRRRTGDCNEVALRGGPWLNFLRLIYEQVAARLSSIMI